MRCTWHCLGIFGSFLQPLSLEALGWSPEGRGPVAGGHSHVCPHPMPCSPSSPCLHATPCSPSSPCPHTLELILSMPPHSALQPVLSVPPPHVHPDTCTKDSQRVWLVTGQKTPSPPGAPDRMESRPAAAPVPFSQHPRRCTAPTKAAVFSHPRTEAAGERVQQMPQADTRRWSSPPKEFLCAKVCSKL